MKMGMKNKCGARGWDDASSCSVSLDNGVHFLPIRSYEYPQSLRQLDFECRVFRRFKPCIDYQSNPIWAIEAANHHSLLRSAVDTLAEDCSDLQRTVVLQLPLPWDCLQSRHPHQVP